MFLGDIVDAVAEIERSLGSLSLAAFLADRTMQGTTLYRLMIVGEAITCLPATPRRRYPEVTWSAAVAVSDGGVRGYFSVDRPTVWEAAPTDAPVLARQVANILAQDYPPANP